MPRQPDDSKPDPSQAALYAVNAATASEPVEDASEMIGDEKTRELYRKLKAEAQKEQEQ